LDPRALGQLVLEELPEAEAGIGDRLQGVEEFLVVK